MTKVPTFLHRGGPMPHDGACMPRARTAHSSKPCDPSHHSGACEPYPPLAPCMTLTRPASTCARSRHGGMVKELFADGVEVTEHRDFAQGRRPASLQAGTIVSGSEHFHAGRLLAQPLQLRREHQVSRRPFCARPALPGAALTSGTGWSARTSGDPGTVRSQVSQHSRSGP